MFGIFWYDAFFYVLHNFKYEDWCVKIKYMENKGLIFKGDSVLLGKIWKWKKSPKQHGVVNKAQIGAFV
jgi:hypothetical protein